MRKLLITCCCAWLFMFSAEAQSAAKAEAAASQCILEYVQDNGGSWKSILTEVETYLNQDAFRKEGESLEQAYLNLLDYRSAIPPKPMPLLPDRQKFKALLNSSGILGGGNTIGFPLMECFLKAKSQFQEETSDSTTFHEIAAMIEAVNKAPEISPNLMFDALLLALSEKDLKNVLYQKAVVLVAMCDIVYIEEITTKRVTSDNPIAEYLGIPVSVVTEEEINNLPYLNLALEQPALFGEATNNKQSVQNLNSYFQNAQKDSGFHGEGTVHLTLTIGTRGEIQAIKVQKGVREDIDKRAVELVKAMPRWQPAVIRGKSVKVNTNITVKVGAF